MDPDLPRVERSDGFFVVAVLTLLPLTWLVFHWAWQSNGLHAATMDSDLPVAAATEEAGI